MNAAQQNQIEQWNRAADGEFIEEQFGCEIYGRDIHCLRTDAADINSSALWLNDLCINLYMELIVRRPNGNMKVQYIDCHFWPLYRQCGYKRAKNYTDKLSKELFNFDAVLIPLLENCHWALAIVRPKQRRIQLLDSSPMADYSDGYVFKQLCDFLKSECTERLGHTLDTAHWTKEWVNDIPKQMNRFDCGVFVCVLAETATRNQYVFNFNQNHMPYFRNKILFEICSGRMLSFI